MNRNRTKWRKDEFELLSANSGDEKLSPVPTPISPSQISGSGEWKKLVNKRSINRRYNEITPHFTVSRQLLKKMLSMIPFDDELLVRRGGGLNLLLYTGCHVKK